MPANSLYSPITSGIGLLVCGTGLLRLRDDVHVHSPAGIKGPEPFEGGHGKEIPVQQQQGVPKSKGCLISVLHHLDHMGSRRDRCTFSLPGSLEPVVEPDA